MVAQLVGTTGWTAIGAIATLMRILYPTCAVFIIVLGNLLKVVTRAGLDSLAAGLQAHRPELLDVMGVIVRIDKHMSECRALTNFTGNAVATLLIGK